MDVESRILQNIDKDKFMEINDSLNVLRLDIGNIHAYDDSGRSPEDGNFSFNENIELSLNLDLSDSAIKRNENYFYFYQGTSVCRVHYKLKTNEMKITVVKPDLDLTFDDDSLICDELKYLSELLIEIIKDIKKLKRNRELLHFMQNIAEDVLTMYF